VFADGQESKGSEGLMVDGFCVATFQTGADVVGDECGHVGPVVLSANALHCLANPWMTC
jgi:hypothetical protein